MSRIKIIAVAGLVFLLISPGLLHSQTEPFILFDVLPGADHTILTQWRMTAERDTLPFEVERSRDKRRWERIASVATHPSHQYSNADTKPGKGLIYYRVRQTGRDGRFLYTAVKWVQISKTGELYVWPNPAKDILHIKTPFTKGSIDIINPEGKQIQKITITDFITEVPASKLSKGLYILHVKYDKEILVEKFIKD